MQKRSCEKRPRPLVRVWWAALGMIATAVALLPMGAIAQMGTTTVQGTVYRADGTPASGTLLLSWPAFTTPGNQAVAAGSLSTAIGANGFVSVNLMPNAGALPGGSYYTAVYHLSDGTVSREYWVVPASATAAIATVRAELEPSTVAVQSVTAAYVQGAISAVSSNYLPLAGGTLSGPLTLNSDPMSPAQAATKHYADQLSAQSLPLSGGALSGPLTVPNFYARQMEGWLYADQWQSSAGSNNGIGMSVAECAAMPYACSVTAPAAYALADIPAWSRFNIQMSGAQQSSQTTPVMLTDQRGGENFITIVDPYNTSNYSSFKPSTNYGFFAGQQLKVDYTGLPPAAYGPGSNFIGNLSVVTHPQGGVLSQLYDFPYQSQVFSESWVTEKNTAEAGGGVRNTVNCLAPGDCIGELTSLYGPAGALHPYDEGQEFWSNTNSETVNVYQGYANGTPAAGAQAITITPTAAGGTQGEHRWLIDTAGGGATYTASALTDNVQPINCNSAYDYATTLTSATTVPTSSAWGCLTSAVTVPRGSLTPGVETVTVNILSGTLSIGLACVADQDFTGSGGGTHGNFETVLITAVQGGGFTASFDKSHPIGGMYFQGGMCGRSAEMNGSDFLSGSSWSNGESGGTTTHPIRFVWPVAGSVDGTNVILWTAKAGAATDSDWSRYSNKTFTLWPGAEVYTVAGANNDTTDNKFGLAPNNIAWGTNDTVEEEQYPYQRISIGHLNTSSWLPHTGGANLFINMLGRVEGQDTGVSIDNNAAANSYNGYGGAWQLPVAAYDVLGPWQFGMRMNTGTYLSAIGMPCVVSVNCGTVQRIVNPGQSATSDYFGYTNTNGNGAGGTWNINGNQTVSGAIIAQGAVTGASINGEVTVDGVTYTTLNAAWNATVSRAIASGQDQTIRLGPGSYPVAATLTEPANGACVSLIGSGGTTMNADSPQIATTLTVPGSLGGDVIFLGNAAQAQGCTFRDLNLMASANATHGFELQWFRGLLIDNVSVNDTTGEGILLGEETTTSGHQASFLLRNTTVSYSSATFTPANRPAFGIHLEKTAMDSHLDDIVVRNAQTAAVYNEGTGNTGYLIHGFGYPYTCTTGPCSNNASSGSAANASYATSYVIYDTGGAGSVWTDTYVDSPAVAGFYVGADGVAIHGGHVQWPDVTSFPNANLAWVASSVSSNLLIADVDCLEMAGGVNWITYAGTSGNPPSYSSVHHLTGCGNYYQALDPAVTTGFSSGGANINDPSGAVPRVWATPLAAAASDAAYAAQLYTGYQGDALQAHFSGVNPFFNVTYQGTIRTNGGIALSTVINTASTLTLTAANKNVIANAASGPQTITLPSCYTTLPDKAMPTGLEFTIIKSDTSSNAVTLTTSGSQLIYSQGAGAATLVLSSPSTQTLVCGPDYNWYVAGTAAATFSGNATTATALAATPAQCPAGTYAGGIAANGTANCLQSWRFTWYGNFAGAFGTSTNNSLGAIWSPSVAIAMTRLDIAVGTAPAGCSTWPVIGIYDSTAAAWLKTVTLASGTYSYRNAVTSVSVAAGHNLSMGVQTAGVGCSTTPGSAQLTMEYTMNQ